MWLKERHAFKSAYCTWPNSYTLRKIIVNKEDVSGIMGGGGYRYFRWFWFKHLHYQTDKRECLLIFPLRDTFNLHSIFYIITEEQQYTIG